MILQTSKSPWVSMHNFPHQCIWLTSFDHETWISIKARQINGNQDRYQKGNI